jgi:transposase
MRTAGCDGFVAVPIASAAPPLPDADIRIEVRRGAVTMNVIWPMTAAGECAHWLRELLR